MRKKFETNVAQEMPKTRRNEPELPWKLKDEDIAKFERGSDEYRSARTGASVLKTRAIFLILLVLVIFTVILYMISNIIVENENIRTGMLKKDIESASLKAEFNRAMNEKAALAQNFTQLEKRVNDLSAQKELFTSVIESLTKRPEEEAEGPVKIEEAAADKKATDQSSNLKR